MSYNNYRSNLEFFDKILSSIKTINPNKDFEYQINKIENYIYGLFSLAKFKPGDIVIFNQDIPVKNDGWRGCYHMLKKGKKSKVISLDWYNNKFIYLIEPLNQTYYSKIEDDYLPVTIPGCYCFDEKFLELDNENIGTWEI